jgi:hypothetical protein
VPLVPEVCDAELVPAVLPAPLEPFVPLVPEV